MLRAMSLVAQWRTMARSLPEHWSACRLRITPARDKDADETARLLGPASPGRSGTSSLLVVQPGEVNATERLFARLDEAAVRGTLELVTAGEPAAPAVERVDDAPEPLAAAWDALVAALADGWSDLLCLVELRSSDDLAPTALALAPVNPSRHGNELAFRFRVAHSFGYGAAPAMVRRCLARLDEQSIPGSLSLLEAFADTRPVLTQGPTFKVAGRAV